MKIAKRIGCKNIKVLVGIAISCAVFLSSGISFAQDTTPPSQPSITSPRNHKIEEGVVYFVWSATDAESGIAGYSYQLDSNPSTIFEVDHVSEGKAVQKRYELSEGTYYFHVAAVDGANNWGPTKHFDLKVISSDVLIDNFDDGDGMKNEIGGETGTLSYPPNTCTATYNDAIVRI